MTESPPNIVAAALSGFRAYRDRFAALTARAEARFRAADWRGLQADSTERLDVYEQCLEAVVSDLTRDHPGLSHAHDLWRHAKTAFERQAVRTSDPDLAETFFNSVSRRILQTAGVDPAVEFVRFQAPPLAPPRQPQDYRVYPLAETPAEVVFRQVLQDSRLAPILVDPAHDALRIHRALKRQKIECPPDARLEVLTTIFYRGMGAYLIGRLLLADGTTHPLAVAFVHRAGRVAADGVITDERGIRILFSYTHSYFLAATENIGGLIGFLQMLMPQRRRAELFISLGYNRHGKTELYRDLTQHQNACRDIFVISPGKRGMVMAVFNMPSDDLVFKVIRDRFAKPKRTTRREVIAKYDYIFRHDRTGRLPDTQNFEHLKFERGCFHPELANELLQSAADSVVADGDELILSFVYVERRVTPLDVYLRSASAEQARAAVIDFGQAIKDMAASNIFPGDMLIKNFGVTELGRVIFYDFDEVCPLTACRFRRQPRAASYEDELAAQPWYLVEENDIFPEEFVSFLGLKAELRNVFMTHHADIFTPEFWQAHQDRIQSNNLVHVYPYRRFNAE
jgi:isocitrate dehydrogenase kinase/phosphatase